MNLINAHSKPSATGPGQKLGLTEVIGYGLGDTACAFALTTVNTYLMLFLTDVYGLDIGQVGAILMIVRLLDACAAPLIGSRIDTIKSTQRYKKVILIGALPTAAFSIACFFAPPLSQGGKLIYAFASYAGVCLLYTAVNTSYSSLSTVLTEDVDDRNRLTGVRLFLANIGNICLTLGVPMLAAYFGRSSVIHGYRISAVIFGTAAVILLLITYCTTTIRIQIPPSESGIHVREIIETLTSNKPLLLICPIFTITFINCTIVGPVGTYFVKYNLGREEMIGIFTLCSSLPGIITTALVPSLAARFNKRDILIVSHLVSLAGLLGMLLTPRHLFGVILCFRLLSAAGATMIMGVIWNIAPDLTDYGEYISHKRLSAVIYAIIGLFYKMGAAIAGIIPSLIMGMTGYAANQEQTAEALQGITFTFLWIPILLTIAALIPLHFYKLDNEMTRRISVELAQRRASEGSDRT